MIGERLFIGPQGPGTPGIEKHTHDLEETGTGLPPFSLMPPQA
jgi:hypothetical protein